MLAASIVILIGFVVIALHYWRQIYWRRLGEQDPSLTQQQFVIWVCKGVLTPLFLWMVINSGIVMAPIVPEVHVAMSSGMKWLPVLLTASAPVLLVVGSYWATLTFGMLIVAIARRVADRGEFLAYGLFWSVLMLPLVALILYFTNWAWAGFALFLWFWPMVHNTIPLLPTRMVLPSYSRAIAKIKLGKYREAEWEVIHQLEECEDDFQGWMMLAQLYANHFNDLPLAAQTILETCAQPNVNPSQIAVALHRLADWHLKLAEDPVAARRALEGICQRFPGTHLERMARQRIDRLPLTREELRQQREGKPLHLPALNDGLDDVPEHHVPDIKHEAAAQAKQWVEKLKQDPDDVSAREELARILAEHLDRPDWALEQIDLLTQMPGQSERKRAEWLSLMAAWQMRYARDTAAARATLERLIREYPQSAQAFAAQRRLNLIDTELRMRQARLAVHATAQCPPGPDPAIAAERGSHS